MTMALSNSLATFRSAGGLWVLLASLMLLSPQEAEAQHWIRTVSVVTPVEDRPVKAFLDTLVGVMERKERLMVKRTPDQEEEMEISALRDRLIEEEGLGLSSATDLFIKYRFSDGVAKKFEEELVSFQFIFREGRNQEDIPILYLDAKREWVRDIMENKAIGLSRNEAPLLPFQREFRFLRIARIEETQIVQIGNEAVREGFDQEKEAIVSRIRDIIYQL